MAFILIDLPMPPSSNHAYATSRTGHRYKTAEVKKWEQEFKIWALGHSVIVDRLRKEFHVPKPNHIVWIDSRFYFPYRDIFTKQGKPKRNDTSNRLKLLHDSVATLIGLDDSYFFCGEFSKTLSDSNRFCQVSLEWRKGP